MTAMAAKEAMADAGLTPADIDGVGMYTMPNGALRSNQYTSTVRVAAMLGMSNNTWFMSAVEGPAYLAGAIPAIDAVASGSCETVLTTRTLVHPGSSQSTNKQIHEYEGDAQFQAPFGALAGAHWASLVWRRHMAKYGSTADQLGYQPVYQREFAALNPKALMREPLSMEDYLNARYISKPLRLYDCEYPISGSGAVIYTTEERARDLAKKPVFIESQSLAIGSNPDFYVHDDLLGSSQKPAAKAMWDRTDLKPEDIDVGGIYDGFTVITLMWLESLGLCGEGEAGAFVQAGHTRLGGKIPINCDGGTLNMGRLHAVNHVIEVTRQLRGESGARQTPGAEVGVVTAAIGAYAGCMLLTGS